MAQPSQLARYRPAVLAVTSLAALYGVYVLYTAFSSPQHKSALHRSNAVHRGRTDRDRSRLTITWASAESASCLGEISIRHKDKFVVSDLGKSGIPSVETLEGVFGPLSDGIVDELKKAAIAGVLGTCIAAQKSNALGDSLKERGMGRLLLAVASHDDDGVRQQVHEIQNALGPIDRHAMENAVERFLATDLWQGHGPSTSTSTDTWDGAETEVIETNASVEPSQELKGLLYHIAEQDARRRAHEHQGIHCEECGERPIRGIRWHCLNCPDFDLCSTCEAETRHPKTHIFAQVKIPLPVLSQPTQQYPLWYAGDARRLHPPLDSDISKQLGEEYHFDEPEMEANYDQFVTIANHPWPKDPCMVGAGINSRAFRLALSSARWPQRFRPNALYDRMFAFYDTDGNGIIGFEEFISGLSYLRGPKRFASLERAIRGFDIDGNGYVDRSDFIQIFRAKHEIQKLLVNDMVETHEHEQTQAALGVIRSSQPISSALGVDDIPRGDDRPREGKRVDGFGDLQPEDGAETIQNDLETIESWPLLSNWRPRDYVHSADLGLAQARLDQRLSRFEEILRNPQGKEFDDSNRAPHKMEAITSQDGQRPEYTSPDALNDDSESVLQVKHSTDDHPLNQDLLWQMVEEGFQQMLDPLFASTEEFDERVLETRAERDSWREEIKAAMRVEETAIERDLSDMESLAVTAAAAAATDHDDPLIATAAQSQNDEEIRQRRTAQNQSSADRGQVVFADPATFSEEAQIADKRLGELLDDLELEIPGIFSDCPFADAEPSHSEGQAKSEAGSPRRVDPTMPQNLPNAPTQSAAQGNGVSADEDWLTDEEEEEEEEEKESLGHEPLPDQRLRYLIALEEREAEIRRAGGPGRMSIESIEAAVEHDKTKALRGLVVGWLDWAGF